MPNPSNADQGQLVEQFRQALADCRKLYRTSARQYAESPPAEGQRTPHQFEELMQDLERGLVVKTFVEVAQSDWQWSDPEYALAGALFEHVWGTRLAHQGLRKALRKVVEQAGGLQWGSLVRPFVTVPALADHVGEVETVVMRLANLVAKIDGQVNPDEEQRLKWIQSELERHLVRLPLDSDRPSAAGKTMARLDAAVGTGQRGAPAGRKGEVPDAKSREQQLTEALAELEGLIGLASVKHDVQELASFLKVQAERERLGLPRTSVSLHMVFCGNPGTGKTTVARLLGRVLGGLGILTRGHLIETDRSGLVAKYAGQTGPKTHKTVDEALDGVLFIDEAYSLVAQQGDDPYGNEAMQALLKRAEDDRHRLVVILAGYPEPMEQLLATNPGLASRFNRRLDFADYTARELGRIFQLMCEKNHYRLPAPTRLKLLLGFQHLLDERDETFGNGRLARNVFEAAIRRLASRIAGLAPLTVELLTTLEAADMAMPDVPEEAYGDLDDATRRLAADCPGCRRTVRFRPIMLGNRVKCKLCAHDFQLDWGELA